MGPSSQNKSVHFAEFAPHCRNALCLGHAHKWQRTTLTFAHRHNNAAGACLVDLKVAIYAFGFLIVRANVTTKMRAVDFNMTVQNEWEIKAANLLKADLKRKGVTYAQLAELLGEKEVNICNKPSQGNSQQLFCFRYLRRLGRLRDDFSFVRLALGTP